MTIWRRKGEWMGRSTYSWPRHLLSVRGQLQAPAALPRGKSPQCPLGRRLGGPRTGEQKNLTPTGTRNPTPQPSSLQPVAILTALSQLPTLVCRNFKRNVFCDMSWINKIVHIFKLPVYLFYRIERSKKYLTNKLSFYEMKLNFAL
jgi:hypothetical protein